MTASDPLYKPTRLPVYLEKEIRKPQFWEESKCRLWLVVPPGMLMWYALRHHYPRMGETKKYILLALTVASLRLLSRSTCRAWAKAATAPPIPSTEPSQPIRELPSDHSMEIGNIRNRF